MADSVSKIGFDVSQALTALDQLAKKNRTVSASLLKMAADAKKVSGSGFDQSMSKAASSAKKASTALKGTEKQAKATGAAMAKAGKQGAAAGKAVTLTWQTLGRVALTQVLIRGVSTLVSAFTQAADAAKKFGLALAEIQTISRGAAGSSAALAVSIQRVANEVGKTSQEVAEGVYQILSNQVTEASQAMGVFEIAARLGRVTASSTADAVSALSSVMNSYGKTADEAADVSDTLFTAVELGRLRLSEIANTIGRVTPLTAALGISFKETAAAIAVMTRTGVRADTAITQLRAVTQKLVKPTEKMVELFRRWGVKDGKTAIATFGGVTGVLKKLAAETGNNSTEMASYFNRVRAIVGQMGIMTEEGKLMVETLEAMKNATGAAQQAWAEFQGSDAFTLEKKQAELQNALTESGSAWVAFFTGLNIIATKTVNVWTALTSNLQASTRQFARDLAKSSEEASEAGIEAMKNFKIQTEEELDGILQAERQVLAKFNSEWNTAMDKAGESTKRLGASVKAALTSTLGELDKQIKPMKDFIKDFDDGQKNIQQQIKDTEAAQEDTEFRKGLKDSTRVQQVGDIEKKSLEEASKGLALYSTRVDELGIKTAQEAFKRSELWQQEAAETAKALGNKFLIRTTEENLLKLQEKKLKALKAQAKLREEIREPVEQALDLLEGDKAKQKGLVDAISKDMEKLAEAATPQESAAIWTNIQDRLKEASEIGFRDSGEAIREALNLQKLPKELADQMTSRQYKVVLDANESIKEIQAELEKLDKQQAAQFDPTGFKAAQSAFVLDRAKGPQESTSQFVGEAADEAKKILLDQEKGVKELAGAQATLKRSQENLGGTQKVLNDFMSQTPGLADVARNALGRLTDATGATQGATERFTQGSLNQQVGTSQTGGAYLRQLQEAQTQLSANKPLEEAQVQNLNRAKAAWLGSASATADAKVQLLGVHASLTAVNKQLADVKLKEGLVDQPKLEDARKLLAALEQKTKDTNEAMNNLVKGSAGLAENTKDFATAANEALGSTGGLEQAWNGVTGSVEAAGKAAVQAWEAVAAAMQLAGQAPGGGAPQFFGGTRYLAAGGPVGQDTVAARLSPDEYVSSGSTTRKFFSELNAMNNGVRPVYREQGGPVTNVGDVNVTVQGGDSSSQTVRDIGRGIERSIKRGLTRFN